jgi:hypothetical protein
VVAALRRRDRFSGAFPALDLGGKTKILADPTLEPRFFLVEDLLDLLASRPILFGGDQPAKDGKIGSLYPFVHCASPKANE